VFDSVTVVVGEHAAAVDVAGSIDVSLKASEFVPVLPALSGVVPGLRRGHAIELESTGLALALMAQTSAAGSWCGVVGLPQCGVLAAAGFGCDVRRLLLVDEPGERWSEVVAVLLEAVDAVVVRLPSARPASGVARRLGAVARKHGSCLLVAGRWEGSMLRLRVVSSLWVGVGCGHGHLRGRRVKVIVEGRGAAGGRPRSVWLWLPGPDGTVAVADLTSMDGADHVEAAGGDS
jgi:hypothetical protein